jgi:hypothetical protein
MNEPTEKIDIHKVINLVKDYSSFLLLLISFLGGLKQFITLCFYSPSLIQFFSLSQVLIDGIGIMIKTIIFFSSIFIGTIIYPLLPRIFRTFLTTILSILTIFFLTLTIFPAYTPAGHLIFQTLFTILIGILFGIIYYYGQPNKRRFILITCIYGLFMIISDHQQPDDLINIKNHNIILNKKYPNATLLYSNDTYLFYGVPKDPKKKIINTGFLLPQKPEDFVVCNFYVEKRETLFIE